MIMLGKPRKPRYFPGIEARRDNLKGRASGRRELSDQLLQAATAQAVTRRVGEYRTPAGPPDPTHDLRHIGPQNAHMTRPATR